MEGSFCVEHNKTAGKGAETVSYYFSMAFATVPDKASAYDLCQEAVTRLTEKAVAQEHVRNMYPSFKLRCTFEGTEPSSLMQDMWVQDIFQIRFVYWPQHKLLALCGDDYPKEVTDLFGSSVGFQNCTDQDYELDAWDSNISIFRACIEGISKAGDETIKSILGYEPDDEDYGRRSAVYQSIFKVLDLDNWLYGRDGCFTRIKMSGLTSSEKIQDVQRWAQCVIRKM